MSSQAITGAAPIATGAAGGQGQGSAAGGQWGGAGGAAGGASGGAQGQQEGGYGGPGGATNSLDPDVVNELLAHYLLIVLGSISIALLTWRLTTMIIRYVRHVACLYNETQRYFARPNEEWAWFKKNILYAPILSKRHNREFQLSSALNMGTLPTRMQLVFLLGYFATNVAFCVMTIDFSGPLRQVAALVRNRTGYLATVNMIPLFLMAGRNNPLIQLLGMSFDTFNLLHRWFGRIVALEALTHTLAWMVSNASTNGWPSAFSTVTKVPFLLWGFVSTCAMVFICIQAASIFRHAYYETFKILHIALAILSVIGLWWHLDMKQLPQLRYLYPVVILWACDRAARFLRVAYHNFGAGGTKALVEALPGGACRVTVTMARPWTFRPGQHAYLYMPSIGFWQSHPFTVAWSEENDHADADRLPISRRDIHGQKKTTISFIIRGRTGFTGALYSRACARPDGKLVTRCLVEGPYRGSHRFGSYGTVMLFAGGVGVTQVVPHVRELVAGYANGTVATRKVIMVWSIQSPEHLEWIRPWMTQVLAMERRREVLRILLFVSRPRSTKEIQSPSNTVQMFPGRPNIDTLIGMEMESQVGTMAVSVCGPGSLSDEVRRAVRNRMYQGSVEFIEEAFSW
ncbi:reductase-like protein [Thermochaetoides thermophila DSM 1495]|uniref:ferric-chelate reductase (NADPH) n=1 Tax=Chaetomium thermophilum (strain DSM 1495 / CBS 144.50 / IMI 039719) TaxID=759272 RepID=G0S6Y6_CHATD|nr:reductase-like protein [Thermochaetoides thermophila DSM 1495]EGS20894.1 reductase-like protein [Thermochaetoides thermophila DSM 1495]